MDDIQKRERIKELGGIIDKDTMVNGKMTFQTKHFAYGALMTINECNESWCDDCEVRKSLGMICSEWIETYECGIKEEADGTYILTEPHRFMDEEMRKLYAINPIFHAIVRTLEGGKTTEKDIMSMLKTVCKSNQELMNSNVELMNKISYPLVLDNFRRENNVK